MRQRKFKWITLLILGFGLPNLQAQNTIHVKEKSGAQTSFALNNIAKISFSGGDVIIHESDGGMQSTGLNQIRYLSFIDFLTDIQIPGIQALSNFTLYPNPVAEQLQIRLEGMENSIVQVDIIDMQGRIVQQQKISNNEGHNTATIHLFQLTEGLYICRLQTGSRIESIKFIKNQ
jgi:hypothetical protein